MAGCVMGVLVELCYVLCVSRYLSVIKLSIFIEVMLNSIPCKNRKLVKRGEREIFFFGFFLVKEGNLRIFFFFTIWIVRPSFSCPIASENETFDDPDDHDRGYASSPSSIPLRHSLRSRSLPATSRGDHRRSNRTSLSRPLSGSFRL